MLIAVACVVPLMAQVQYGQFDGIVTDPTGAAIANARLTVTNATTDLSISTTTNSGGGRSFFLSSRILPPASLPSYPPTNRSLVTEP
jgi:Carboxypeptidase regulatory-like domain